MNNDLNELISDVAEQLRYLQDLGVDGLAVQLVAAKDPVPVDAVTPEARYAPAPASIPAVIKQINFEAERSVRNPAGSRLAALPSLTKRAKPGAVIGRSSDGPAADLASVRPAAGETVDDVRADIGNCVRCPLHVGRTQIVHSTGNLNARLMFVGEAPGADEDEQGFPFVGRAGKLLTSIMEAIGFSREDVFIGNINRCRPPGNRAPVPVETATCRPFLLREVAVIQPKVIVVLGNTATQNLLDIKTPISKLRGQFQDYFGVKVMPTFHPAYLLRDPHKKREVWEDMKQVRDYLAATN